MGNKFDTSSSDDFFKVIVRNSPLKSQAKVPSEGFSKSRLASESSTSFDNSGDKKLSVEYLSESHCKEDLSIYKSRIRNYKALT